MQPQHQEWGEVRRRDDYTVPSTLPEPPSPSTGFPLPTSLGPGMWKKPWESIAPIYFFLRSWEQRGQNLERNNVTEKRREKVSERGCPPPCSSGAARRLPQLSHSPLPPRLGRQPHTGKVEPLNGTLKRRKMEEAEVRGPGQGAEERKEVSSTDSSEVFPYSVPLEKSWRSQGQPTPPSSYSAVPLFNRFFPSCTRSLVAPRTPSGGKTVGSHIRVVTANHLSIGDLVTKAIGGFVGIHRHIQHIRGVDTAKGH